MKVGVLGGGQLARMLALAGHPLGVETVVIDPATDACSAPVVTHIRAAYDDLAAVDRLVADCDVVTFEFEHIPTETLKHLEQYPNVFPHPRAVIVAQDRLLEKTMFRELGIPLPGIATIDSRDDLERAVIELGLPLVLKTRTQGYDGKGQAVIRVPADVDTAWAELGGQPLLAEGFVAFEREVSMIAARNAEGDTVYYPLVENHHEQGILRLSRPYRNAALQVLAEDYTRRVLERLDYVGVMAFEFFVKGDALLANEIAPRIHNSGHWTIEGAQTSQFENHLRAVLGLPLGACDTVEYSAMVNFIGHMPAAAEVLAIPHAHLHCYGKEDRPGRKVGHATVRASDERALGVAVEALLALA